MCLEYVLSRKALTVRWRKSNEIFAPPYRCTCNPLCWASNRFRRTYRTCPSPEMHTRLNSARHSLKRRKTNKFNVAARMICITYKKKLRTFQ